MNSNQRITRSMTIEGLEHTKQGTGKSPKATKADEKHIQNNVPSCSSSADNSQSQKALSQYTYTWLPVNNKRYGSSKTEKIKNERKPKPVYVDTGTQYRKEDLNLFCDDCLAGKNLEKNESLDNVSIKVIHLNVPAKMLPPGMSSGSHILPIITVGNQFETQRSIIPGISGLNSGQTGMKMNSVSVTQRRGVKRPSSGFEFSNSVYQQNPSTSTAEYYNDEEEYEEIRMETENYGFGPFTLPASKPFSAHEYVNDAEDETPIDKSRFKFYGETLTQSQQQPNIQPIMGLDRFSVLNPNLLSQKVDPDIVSSIDKTPPENIIPLGYCEESYDDEYFGLQDTDLKNQSVDFKSEYGNHTISKGLLDRKASVQKPPLKRAKISPLKWAPFVQKNLNDHASTSFQYILQILRTICPLAMKSKCDHPETCDLNHKLPAHSHIIKILSRITKDELQKITKFLFENGTLFNMYFPVLSNELGKRGLKHYLLDAIKVCDQSGYELTNYKWIVNGLIRAQVTPVYAIRTLLNCFGKKDEISYGIIVEIILKNNCSGEFLDDLIQIAQTNEFKCNSWIYNMMLRESIQHFDDQWRDLIIILTENLSEEVKDEVDMNMLQVFLNIANGQESDNEEHHAMSYAPHGYY